jgi:hypothetical protein
MEGLGLARRDDLDFDSIRIFTVHRVVARASGIRVAVFVQDGKAS